MRCHTGSQHVKLLMGREKNLLYFQLCSCTNWCYCLLNMEANPDKRWFESRKLENWSLNSEMKMCQNCKPILTIRHETRDCQSKITAKKKEDGKHPHFESSEEATSVLAFSRLSAYANSQEVKTHTHTHTHTHTWRCDERLNNQNWWTEENTNEPVYCCAAPATPSPFFSTRCCRRESQPRSTSAVSLLHVWTTG